MGKGDCYPTRSRSHACGNPYTPPIKQDSLLICQTLSHSETAWGEVLPPVAQ
jgi:hypothetical protein